MSEEAKLRQALERLAGAAYRVLKEAREDRGLVSLELALEEARRIIEEKRKR